MADVMPHKSEEGLNAIGPFDDVADVTRPLFARTAWFDRLHAGCLADLPAVTIDGIAGSARCRLRLIEVAPGELAALANWYSFCWMPQLGGGDAAGEADALRAALAAARARACRLALAPVRVDDGMAQLLVSALRRAGWTVRTSVVSRRHWLDTQGRSFADWWAGRPGQLRSTVRRKAKRGAVTCAIDRAFDDAAWRDFEAIYAASWKPTESHPAFLRDWARAAAAEGALRLGIARMAGEAVAAQFWTTDAGTAHIHKLAQRSGADIDEHSPGTLLSHAMFADAFDHDHAVTIDFGTGDDRYKQDWMEQSADLVAIHALDLRQPRAWRSLARAGLSRVAGRLHKG